MADIDRAYQMISAKARHYDALYDYYDGHQPLVYAAERLREVFKRSDVHFTENWCRLVVDVTQERMQLGQITGPEQSQEVLDKILADNEIALISDAINESLLITGESYLTIWPADDGTLEIYANDPRICTAFYDPAHPRSMLYAAKLFGDLDGGHRMVLYYPDRIENYRSPQKELSSASSFVLDSTVSNEYGIIPVFHFQQGARGPRSDISDVIPLQDAINKLLTDMMVAAEFGAFRQRWIITNASTDSLRNAPNEVWTVPAGGPGDQPSQVGEFSPTDLSNYLDAIDRLAGDISRVSRVPLHYFYAQGGFPSGEALMAMEAPLIFKAHEKLERIEPVWRHAIAFALTAAGVPCQPNDVAVSWQNVQIMQPKTEAEIHLLDIQAGIPLETSLRRTGWSDEELADMAEAKANVGESLLRQFDQGAVA